MKTKITSSFFTDPEIILVAFFSVFLHLIFANNLEYHRDEMLYMTLGQHPAAGYASVPPLIGWISWLIQTLFGSSVFAVRLFPSILGGALILITAVIARELGGSRYAGFLSAVGVLISMFFLRTYFLFLPVQTEIFLWTLCIYMVIRYINTSDDKYLILFGIVAGISLLNKYLVMLLFSGLFIIIPFTQYRYIFRKKGFYLGLAAGFIIFLPNLIWQVSKGFPVFMHMHELYRTQLVHMNIPFFLTEQLMMPAFGSFFTVSGIIFLLSSKDARRFRMLGILAAYVILLLMLLKGKSYYTLGVFPLLIAAGAVSYDEWINKRWIKVAFPLILIILTYPLIPMGVPAYKSDGLKKYFNVLGKYNIEVGRRFEDGSIHSLPQDYADMLGWDELTQVTARAYQMVENKQATMIYGENYGQASAINIIGKKYGLPGAFSFSESFQYWIPQHFDPDLTSIIYINDKPGDDIKALFGKITAVGNITNKDAREYGTTVYLCEYPRSSFNEFWQERLKRVPK